MKSKIMYWVVFITIFYGCSSNGNHGSNLEHYQVALKTTAPDKKNEIQLEPIAEKKAIKDFTFFYADFSSTRIEKHLRALYAENAYFRDGFREVKGIDEIEQYFLKSVEPLHSCTFEIQDAVQQNGEFYFRWIMKLTLNRKPSEIIEETGMSHVRFNPNGQIVFHQDYWDTSVVFERLPVVGTIIKWIKKDD